MVPGSPAPGVINTAALQEHSMRYHEISPPSSHPHVAEITIDPVHFRRLQRLTEDHPEVRLLNFDDREPDCWTVWIGCASEVVLDRLEDGWG
jgi:hypothetical protein